jgi:hypothetical protein
MEDRVEFKKVAKAIEEITSIPMDVALIILSYSSDLHHTFRASPVCDNIVVTKSTTSVSHLFVGDPVSVWHEHSLALSQKFWIVDTKLAPNFDGLGIANSRAEIIACLYISGCGTFWHYNPILCMQSPQYRFQNIRDPIDCVWFKLLSCGRLQCHVFYASGHISESCKCHPIFFDPSLWHRLGCYITLKRDRPATIRLVNPSYENKALGCI